MTNLGSTAPLASPLYTSAVYTIPDLDALDAIYAGGPGYIYARDAHPNAHALAAKLAALQGGTWGLVCGSGMASLSAAILGLVSQGDLIFASDRLYGRTTQLLRSELQRFNVAAEFHDVCVLDPLRAAMEKRKPKMLLVETMSNPLCRVPDLRALVGMCRQAGCTLVVDNTFATPQHCKPLELGADLVMESLTKMIGGHSDVTLGFLAGKDRSQLEHFTKTMSIWGFSGSPFDCWMAERGLETLDVRMRAASSNAAKLAEWLAAQPGVSRVVYPGLVNHPDHTIAAKLLTGGFGNMLCFELAGRDAVNRFMQRAPGIPFSPSLGHTRTTISHPASTSHRHDSPEDRARQSITDGLIRVSVGCEDYGELIAEMRKGLA